MLHNRPLPDRRPFPPLLQGHWRFPGHALEQGYVYILTHPGTPTVFWDHVYENEHMRHVVKRLVEVRKRNGIHARSQVRCCAGAGDAQGWAGVGSNACWPGFLWPGGTACAVEQPTAP